MLYSTLALLFFLPSISFVVAVEDVWLLDFAKAIATEQIDPVVSPNQQSSHMHRIFGGSAIKASYNFDEYSNAACSTAPVQADLSDYWAPQLYFIDQDASNNTIYVPLNAGVRIYYNLNRNSANETVKPFPEGLRMLTGNPNNKAPDPRLTYTRFVCQNPGANFAGNTGQDNFNFPTDCQQGMKLTIRFPPCWDGVNLYKSDGSHVAFTGPGENVAGACPFTHPYRFPGIQMELIWNTNAWAPGKSLAGRLAWANGDTTGYGAHADFVNGWKTDVLAAALVHPKCVGGIFPGPVRMDSCPVLAASWSDSKAAACQPQYGTLQEPTGVQDYVPIPALPGCNPLWGASGGKPSCKPAVAKLDVSSLTGTDGPYIAPTDQQFKLPLPTNPGWNYVGCMSTQSSFFANQINYYDAKLTPQRCQASCLASGLPFAAMAPIPSFACFCGDSLSTGVALTDGCTSACPGEGTSKCGGDARASVYYAPPSTPVPVSDYMGCYGLPPVTANGLAGRASYSFNSATMTKQVCMQACIDRQSTWAYTTFNTYCYCGDGPYSRGSGLYRPDDFCNAPCKGNTSQPCGGQAMLSVYNLTASGVVAVDTAASKPRGWQGCFQDAAYGSVPLTGNVWLSSSMKPSICVDGCAELGFSAAAVQSGSRCLCGDQWSGGGILPPTQCTTPCSGDSNTTCGSTGNLERYTTSVSNVSVESTRAARPAGYLGCYYTPAASDGLSNYTFTSKTMTVEVCAAGCQQMGYQFAGLQGGSRCKCGTSAVTLRPWISSYCNTRCVGNSTETCGGGFYMEAYDASEWSSNSGPSSEITLGCFTDPSANGGGAPYGFTTQNNTRRLCRSACNEINYPLAIMTAGNKCLCSRTWTGGQQLPTSQCNLPCSGNSTQICGGSAQATLYNATGAYPPDLPTEPGYLGCFSSPSASLALQSYSYSSGDMTPNVCRRTCSLRGFQLAGLYKGGSCACGTANGSTLRVPTVLCNRPCAGNSTQLCGADAYMGVFNTTGATIGSSDTPGCYSDVQTMSQWLYGSSFMTNEICASQCAVAGYAYAGTTGGTLCRCGNAPATIVAADSSCSAACSGDSSATCGASNRITSVKTSSTAPVLGQPFTYNGTAGSLGCYKDQGTPKLLSAMVYQAAAMTPSQCISNCNGLGYAYAGVEESKRCYCDNNVNITKSNFRTSMTDCNAPCSGDASLTCGAGYTMQLYDVKQSGIQPADASATAEGYQGCYLPGTMLTSASYSFKGTISATLCRRTCRVKGFSVAAVTNGGQCTCTSDRSLYGAVQPLGACVTPCNGNSSEICGSGNMLSIYDTTGPGSQPPASFPRNYVGCFTDSDMSAKTTFKVTSNTLTNSACASVCEAKGAKIWATYQGNTCWCGSSLPATQVLETACARSCPGSSSEMCGGSNGLSVFSSLSFGSSAPSSTSSTLSTSSIASANRTTAASPTKSIATSSGTTFAGSSSTLPGVTIAASITRVTLVSSSQAAASSTAPAVVNATFATISGWTSGRCLADTATAHALNYTYATSSTLTAAKCASLCQDHQFFGLKAGNSCFCSNNIINNVTVSDSRCDLPCGGQASNICGGDDALLLYRSNTWLATSSSSITSTMTATATRTASTFATGSMTTKTTTATRTSSSLLPSGALIVTQSVTDSSCDAVRTTTVYVTVAAGANAARTATPARRHRGFVHKRRPVIGLGNRSKRTQ